MKTYDCEQGTSEWFDARRGKATASRIADVMTKTNSGWGAGRANYAAELIAERLSGASAESYSSAAMQWGTDHESEARNIYALMFDATPVLTGFVDHPGVLMSGASPDALIAENGLVEIKCPNTATHIKTLRGGSIAGKYIKQMHWQMMCTQRKWCDFVSYDPRLPPEMQLHVSRVYRDSELAFEIESAVIEFLVEVDKTVADLRSKYPNAQEIAA